MKIVFSIDEKYKNKYYKEIEQMEKLINAKGFNKVCFGYYEGSHIVLEDMAEIQISLLLAPWFVNNANSLWMWFDEKNENGEEILRFFKEKDRAIKSKGYFKAFQKKIQEK